MRLKALDKLEPNELQTNRYSHFLSSWSELKLTESIAEYSNTHTHGHRASMKEILIVGIGGHLKGFYLLKFSH